MYIFLNVALGSGEYFFSNCSSGGCFRHWRGTVLAISVKGIIGEHFCNFIFN